MSKVTEQKFIGTRCTKEYKILIEEYAKKDNRTVSHFIKNALDEKIASMKKNKEKK